MNKDKNKNENDLANQYAQPLYKFCRSLAYSKEEADDLFQETFLHALERPGKIKTSPLGFLMSTAHFIFKSWQRKHARRQRIAPTGLLDTQVPSPQDIPTDLEAAEDVRLTRRLINDLDEKYRMPIILHYSAHMSLAEIATFLDIPLGTVKSRLHTGRKQIEKGLIHHGYTPNTR